MSSEKKHYAKHINKKFIWLFANIAVALISVGTSSTSVHATEKATGADRQSSTTQAKSSNTSANSFETFSDDTNDQLDDTSNSNSVKPFIFAHDTTIIAGPDAKWNPADNIDSATDSEGQPITVADMTIVGSVDPTKIGVYSITYDYTDPTTGDSAHSTITVHVIGIQTKDTTLTADPDAKWDPVDNFVSATGSDGKALNLSELTVSDNVDPTTPGTYTATYSYGYISSDGKKYSASATATITVLAPQADIQVKDSTLITGPNTTWQAADNFVSATDIDGKPLTLSDLKISGNVDTTTPGTYHVTYSYTDRLGKEVNETAAITVVASQADIKVKDSTLTAGPSTNWQASDNFISAIDANGSPLELSDLTVNGNVDTTKPGTYKVTYSYTDSAGNVISKTATITVVASQTDIKVKDSTLTAGPNTNWQASDNFISATDANGSPLELSDLTVNGNVDPTKPGTYKVTYSYTDSAGNVISKTATITVIASQANIKVKDSTLTAGPKAKWQASDNFISATDANGKSLELSDLTVNGSVDPTKPGTYKVTYSYTDSTGNKINATATITVVASQANIKVKNTTLIAGPRTKWQASDNFISATDANGNPLELSDLTVSGNVDTTKPGTYTVTYSYTDSAGNVISKTATIIVVASQANIKVKDSKLIAGPSTKWQASDNFISATDANGNPLELSDLNINGSVDPTKSGTYKITYSYTDAAGNKISATATITVIASQADIKVKDSKLIAGPKTNWKMADNFISATDANGNSLDLSDLTVSGNVDPTKPGTYKVTYSYTDSAGNVISKTATITVVASQADIKVKDSKLIAGPNTKWQVSDNFISATDANGNPLHLSDLNINGNVDPTKPETYYVTYSYTDEAGNTVSATATITVIASPANIKVKDSTLIIGSNTKWQAGDNFISATDANGSPLRLSDLTITGNVDLTKPGTYKVTYSYTDTAGNVVSATAIITVVKKSPVTPDHDNPNNKIKPNTDNHNKQSKLPQTGEKKTDFISTGLAMILAALSLLLIIFKKRWSKKK